MGKYVIGVDFGTLSGRASVVDTRDGRELASAVMNYPGGVIDRELPSGRRIPPSWALQNPSDYLPVLISVVREAVIKSGVELDEIEALGLDCTACTVFPVKRDGTPLAALEDFRDTPLAYALLWKHHGGEYEAGEMTRVARERGEDWLDGYGGKISSEWLFPKLWHLLKTSPEVYEAADYFVEAGDWLVWQLTGVLCHSECIAGYKNLWCGDYPPRDYLRALDPRLENLVGDKLNYPLRPIFTKAGGLTAALAAALGLRPGTAVAVANIDAHASVPSAGICEAGRLIAIIGTSTCHMVLSTEKRSVPGICGCVKDGMVPGFYGYEAGQSGVGDIFDWFCKSCVPASYEAEAARRGESIHKYLRGLASALRPGESGLLALDWWNGNRSVLVDFDLSGLILGLTLTSRPEEVYRALLEATAYGTRMIIESFRAHGVAVDTFIAAGGIPQKDPLMMQIYADVLNMPVYVTETAQCGALGSAISAAAALEGEPAAVIRRMGRIKKEYYRPIDENVKTYELLYREYRELHDWYGRGGSDVMKRLSAIRRGLYEGK